MDEDAESKVRETQRIWSTLPGSQVLFKKYGYYPTMHDAHILKIDINSTSRTVTIDFYYYDGPGGPENDIHTIFTMVWAGVVTFEKYFEDNWLYEMDLFKRDDLIEARMLESYKGTWGIIVAKHLEISNVHAPVKEYVCDDPELGDIQGFRLSFR